MGIKNTNEDSLKRKNSFLTEPNVKILCGMELHALDNFRVLFRNFKCYELYFA